MRWYAERAVEVGQVVEGVLEGERRAVARAISMVEDGADGLPDLIGSLYPRTGNAYTVGLTGSPGVGKSSLAAELVTVARRHDRTVAVLAVDPTSPFTGGALLGDRLRMQSHATDPGVFIRSMATRGHLGGLALAAPEAVRVLDASGAGLVIVETVGVGQAEVEVATAADTTLVVVAPGWGDAVQASKAGILEIADVFVVNKADRPGADEAVRDLEVMLKMGPDMDWTPPVVRTSTQSHEGVDDDLWEAIEGHRKHLESSGELERRRRARILREVEDMVSIRLRARAAELLEAGALESVADDLVARRVDPYRATAILLERMEGG
jgi:LAO/AO transport system kinase